MNNPQAAVHGFHGERQRQMLMQKAPEVALGSRRLLVEPATAIVFMEDAGRGIGQGVQQHQFVIAQDTEEPALLESLNQRRAVVTPVHKVTHRKHPVAAGIEVLLCQVAVESVQTTVQVADHEITTALVAPEIAMLCQVVHDDNATPEAGLILFPPPT